MSPTHSAGYVLALGGANMDVLGAAHSALVMTDSNPGSIRCAPGGVARNVAENLARLGHATHLLSAVGDDAFGHNLLQATQAAGVNTGACAVLPQRNTSTYMSLHGPQGELALAVSDMDILVCITPQFLAPYTGLIHQAQMIMADCNLDASTLAWLLAQANTTVVVDAVSSAKCQRIRPLLPHITLLKINQSEAQALSSLPCHSTADQLKTATWLHTQGVQQVLISLGARGMFWSDANKGHGWQEVLAGEVVNVNGAGDALLAGWMHAMLQEMPLPQAARFAQACAAYTAACSAANHPGLSAASIHQFMTLHHGPSLS